MKQPVPKLLASEVDLVYRSKVKVADRSIITSSKEAYDVLMAVWDLGKMELQEQFKILMLNRANAAIGFYPLSTGGVTGTVADPKLIFMAALKMNACSLILAHNHPSGSLRPSSADEELTSKIKNAGSFLDIKVLDYLIVSHDGYYSFADEGNI